MMNSKSEEEEDEEVGDGGEEERVVSLVVFGSFMVFSFPSCSSCSSSCSPAHESERERMSGCWCCLRRT